MLPEELSRREAELTDALRTFDWKRVDSLGQDLVTGILRESVPIPESAARRILRELRRKRRFPLMGWLADALVQCGQRTPQIRRQYAQALIDQGNLGAAELVLQSILQDTQSSRPEEIEVRGLLGRIYKQLYMNANASGGPYPATQPFLERAINEYLDGYRLAPQDNYWHGINVVALLDRGRRDGFSLQGLPETQKLAHEILATLQVRQNEAVDGVPAFETATALEAWVALHRAAQTDQNSVGQTETLKQVGEKALEYSVSSDADAFEVASTLRQFLEVWQMTDEDPLGSRVLPILRAALLRRESGGVKISSQEARQDLEKVFGADRFQGVLWYKKGLQRCQSIARIERSNGVGYGTGWLVRAQDFFPGENGLLLVTNAHVVSPTPYPHALLPFQARANFQMLDAKLDIEDDVRWTSPVGKLDATFLRLKGDLPQVDPLIIHTHPVAMAEPVPRLYIIGHPGGGDLAFSLQDNYLLACNERLLHYRTPTEGGSSGSPVFEADDWQVVALHHAGDTQMDRIDGHSGIYEANEGIAIQAIQRAIQDSN